VITGGASLLVDGDAITPVEGTEEKDTAP